MCVVLRESSVRACVHVELVSLFGFDRVLAVDSCGKSMESDGMRVVRGMGELCAKLELVRGDVPDRADHSLKTGRMEFVL